MESKPKVHRIIIQILIILIILTALLFVPAGRLDWLQAWVLIFFILIYFLLYVQIGISKDPDQTRERSQMAKNVKPWDKVIMRIYTAILPTVFILARLDAGRFRWSTVSMIWQLLAWIGLAFAGGIILWTVRSNTYLSRYARIQDDRGQQVVATGPYRIIRHPMYLGILTLFLCMGPALGSWVVLFPGLLIDLLFVIRTGKEDKMLQEELDGYKQYSQVVRFRLIPWIW